MAPILIDKRDLLKLAVISVLSIVLAFSGGYLFGLKQVALEQLEQATLDASYQSAGKYQSDSNDQMPEVTDIDLNEPVTLSQGKTTKKVELAIRQVATKSIVTESIATAPAPAPEAVSTADTVKNNNVKEGRSVTFNRETFNFDVGEPYYTSSSENRVKFTIQVAVYDGLKNAESMMISLQEKNLDAYVSGYTAKSSKRRFNVRFGYFLEKKMALSALENYIDDHQADGYLVNFSAENIVSFAEELVDGNGSDDVVMKSKESQQSLNAVANEVSDNTVQVESISGSQKLK